MGIFKSAINWLKGVLGIQVKDITGVQSVEVPTDILDHLDRLIPVWEQIYRGDPAWSDKATSRLNMAKVLCEYLSSYNTAELEISVSDGLDHGTQDDPAPCPAQEFIDKLLNDNAFEYKLRTLDESKEALGGAAIKPYNVDKRIVLDYVTAPNFIPLKADNRRVTDAIFVTRTVKGNTLYRLLETHTLAGGVVTITNRLFKSDIHSGVLGTEVPLTELPEYANLLPEARFERDLPLFVYIYPAIANNKDGDSLLGISRFANSIDTLKAIDMAFTELQKERIRARKKIIVPADWLRRAITNDGISEANFDPDTDVYQWMNKTTVDDGEKPTTFDPTYKIEDYTADISFHLDTLCLQTGLSAGAISFNPDTGVKTATEIRSENSRTFGTVGKNQTVLKQAIEDLVENILYLATLPDFALLEMPKDGFEVKVNFDDSITPDRETYINEGLRLVTAGTISQYTYRTQYLGMTKEEAEAEADRVAAENPTVPDAFNGA